MDTSTKQKNTAANDSPSILWALISYFVPIAGIILWIVFGVCGYPLRAKSAALGTLAYIITEVVSVIILIAVFSLFFIIGILFGLSALLLF